LLYWVSREVRKSFWILLSLNIGLGLKKGIMNMSMNGNTPWSEMSKEELSKLSGVSDSKLDAEMRRRHQVKFYETAKALVPMQVALSKLEKELDVELTLSFKELPADSHARVISVDAVEIANQLLSECRAGAHYVSTNAFIEKAGTRSKKGWIVENYGKDLALTVKDVLNSSSDWIKGGAARGVYWVPTPAPEPAVEESAVAAE